MVSQDDILAVLRMIDDPEMPISIVDLGLVERVEITGDNESRRVEVVILPTFVGCPALPMIEQDIRRRVGEMDGVGEVAVRFIHDPPWSVDRISEPGRAALREHGVVTPPRGGQRGKTPSGEGDSVVSLHTSAVTCPFCDSDQTELDSPFGPTRCRMIFYCRACKNTFEQIKRV